MEFAPIDEMTTEEMVRENLLLTREIHAAKEIEDENWKNAIRLWGEIKQLLSDALEPGDSTLLDDVKEIKEEVKGARGDIEALPEKVLEAAEERGAEDEKE